MCGIIGLITNYDSVSDALKSLYRLEYRGYDSSGIAVCNEGKFEVRKSKGKIQELEKLLIKKPLFGSLVIGHTRWATHGKPADINAHPMTCGKVCLVHNGIIDNFNSLKNELIASKAKLISETDTEIICHLLNNQRSIGYGPMESLENIQKILKGAYAISVMYSDEPEKLFVIRQGAPLAVGKGNDEAFVGSDYIAMSHLSKRIMYLEDGDWGCISKNGHEIFNNGNIVNRKIITILDKKSDIISKGRHKHFMHKEIHQQPIVVGETLQKYINSTNYSVNIKKINWNSKDRLILSGCGTAFYACLVARYWFENIAKLPTECEISSELRFRPLENGIIKPHKQSQALFISQSGETMDTLEALRHCNKSGYSTLAICNVPFSTIEREANDFLHTCAGVEISVASTKAFTAQLVILFILAIQASFERGYITISQQKYYILKLQEIPRLLAKIKQSEKEIIKIANQLSKYKNIMYIGRGTCFPLAMEGAMKLKEISYIHAEGVAAGELKHGSIALLDKNFPVVVLAPPGPMYDKTINNLQEVASRDAPVILLSDAEGCKKVGNLAWKSIVLPESIPEIAPMTYAMPLHLLAYYVAVKKGCDVDQPRNLAKSVTVE